MNKLIKKNNGAKSVKNGKLVLRLKELFTNEAGCFPSAPHWTKSVND